MLKNREEAKMIARMDREREAKLNRAKAKMRVPPPAITRRVKVEPVEPVSPQAIHDMAVGALPGNRR
jgi:hypothetical protein